MSSNGLSWKQKLRNHCLTHEFIGLTGRQIENSSGHLTFIYSHETASISMFSSSFFLSIKIVWWIKGTRWNMILKLAVNWSWLWPISNFFTMSIIFLAFLLLSCETTRLLSCLRWETVVVTCRKRKQNHFGCLSFVRQKNKIFVINGDFSSAFLVNLFLRDFKRYFCYI